MNAVGKCPWQGQRDVLQISCDHRWVNIVIGAHKLPQFTLGCTA